MWVRGRTVALLVLLTATAACLLTLTLWEMPGVGPAGPSAAGTEAAGGPADGDQGLRRDELDKVNKALELIERRYMLPVDREKLLDGAIRGMLESLGDPYSMYLPEEEAEKFADTLEGVFTGIGAELMIEKGNVVVVSPIKGSPAEKAGLQPRDVLLSVNGQPLQGLTLNEAVAKIRGPKGTKAKLRVRRPGGKGEISLELVRDRIDLVTVRGELGPDGIGRLGISQFSFDTAEKVGEELAKLEKGGMKALVIDVRNNPGGVLQSVVEVAELFLPRGKTVVQYEDRGGARKTETAKGDPGTGKPYPLFVLVNEGSASASEILAGALQQSAGATIVGTTTYGKGTVQVHYNDELGDGSTVKLTVSKWLLPDGTWIHEKGIVPDVQVEQPAYYKAARLPRDRELRADMTGDDVRHLQLILSGVGTPADRTDGYFSPGTEEAVKQFQKREGLPVTGVVNEETAVRLEEALYRALLDPANDAQWNAAHDLAASAAGGQASAALDGVGESGSAAFVGQPGPGEAIARAAAALAAA